MASLYVKLSGDVLAAFVLSLTLFLHQVHKGAGFSMLTTGHYYVRNAGDTVDLDCEFNSPRFDLFDNPVLWIKTQYGEHSRINIMSNINAPFMNTSRFRVTFSRRDPVYRLTLSITRLSLEDVGNYTCEIRGPETSVLGAVRHTLFVRAQVTELVISTTNCSDLSSCNGGTTGGGTPPSLSFVEDQPSFLQCTAAGANPAPDLRLVMGEFDLTYRFKAVTQSVLQGHRGLRVLHHTVHTRTSYLILSKEDDGKKLTCQSAIEGLPMNETSSVIHVHFSPIIECVEGSAHVNQRNVHVRCRVRSRPDLSSLQWVLDDNETTVTEGKVMGEMWTLVFDVTAGVWDVDLYFKVARPAYFRTYTLLAENGVGKSQRGVRLVEGEKDELEYYHEYSMFSNSGHVDYTFYRSSAVSRDRRGQNTSRRLINLSLGLSATTAFLLQLLLSNSL